MKRIEPEEITEFIQSAEAQEFLKSYRHEDPQRLLLKFAGNPPYRALSEQLALRQKLRAKLPEWTQQPAIIFPVSVSTEQSSSEETARLKAARLAGKSLLDITGGMGVDSYYFSQSFEKVHYWELQSNLCALAKHNFKMLRANNIEVNCGDGPAAIENSPAELIYADPARRNEQKQKVHLLEDYLPNLLPLIPEVLAQKRQWLIKSSPMLDISLALKQLKYVDEIWIISVRNDCKEVLYYLKDLEEETPLIRTYNIPARGEVEYFEFYPGEDDAVNFAPPAKFLYEPNAAIQKSGGINALGVKFNLSKLHPNTQLLSGEDIPDFPGKKFRIRGMYKPYDNHFRKQRYNVIVRNYPDKASQIEKRLKIKSSDKDFLIASQLMDSSYVFFDAGLCN